MASITAINTAASVPATYVHNTLAVNTDLTSTTYPFIGLQCKLTVGATLPLPGKPIKFCFGFTNTNLTSSPDVSQLSTWSFFYAIPTTNPSETVSITTSPQIPVTGNYLVTWVNIDDPLGAAVTLDSGMFPITI